MSFLRTKPLFAALVCLCLGLGLLVTACSDRDRDGGPAATAKVNFTFDLANTKTEVPAEVAKFAFIGYSDATMETQAHADTKDKDPSKVGSQQTVTLDDVPVKVVIFRVNFLDADGTALYYADSQLLNLTAGAVVNAELGEVHPIVPTTTVTLNITNAYALNIPQAKYAVELINAGGETVQADGETAYTLTNDAGNCTIACQVPEDEYTVSSVTLSNPANNIPFEWLDYAVPYALTDNAATLDVQSNEFASSTGDGSENNPYLVANPRQLDNVRHHSNGSTKVYVSQTKDIDFAGSCGLTLAVGLYQDNKLQVTATTTDASARFYNQDATATGSMGWVGLGGLTQETRLCVAYQGNNHTIHGLVSYAPGEFGLAGLFAYCSLCDLADLTIAADCTFYGETIAGSLIAGIGVYDGSASENYETSISNCHSLATVASCTSAGGLCCEASAGQLSLDGCTFAGTVWVSSASYSRLGGLAETATVDTSGTISNCAVTGQLVQGSYGVGGGLISELGRNITIDSCQVKASYGIMISTESKVEYEDAYFGGLVGYCQTDEAASPELAGTTSVAVSLDCSKNNASKDVYVGGVYGTVTSNDSEAIQKVLKQHVNITGSTYAASSSEKVYYYHYCGKPAIDSLD